jgi:hypothetical protein
LTSIWFGKRPLLIAFEKCLFRKPGVLWWREERLLEVNIFDDLKSA